MRITKLSFYLLLLLAFAFSSISYGEGENGKRKENKLLKATAQPSAAKFNINNISTWIYNDGQLDLAPSGDSGFEYPIGSGKTVFYESGFVYGGYVDANGDGKYTTDEFRISGSTYNRGQVPGRILDNGQGEDPNAPHIGIYRVRRDYKDQAADFSKEMRDENKTKDQIIAQYDADWKNWPAQYGAPYEDVNKDGKYDPNVDIPGVPGADQTLWFVANDTNPVVATKLYGSVGMGVEMQSTIWGYNQQNALGNALFRRFILINKSSKDIDSMYVCMWSDPDLGDAWDDFTGNDIELSLGFVYNADDDDSQYGANSPACGFDFFQGPVIPGAPSDRAIYKGKYITGYKNLPMTAFFYFTQGDAIYRDPILSDFNRGALWFKNLFEGKVSSTGQPFRDPKTKEPTKFPLSGDPISGKGWVDGVLHRKNDRRFGLVSGPFKLERGDTQEVVVGQLAAGGTPGIDRLTAVGLLKYFDLQLQQAYNNFFNVPTPPKSPVVEATPLDRKIILTWGTDQATVKDIEAHSSLGYNFQGYVVYQLPRPDAQLEEAKIVATFDKIDNILSIESKVFDPASKGITNKFTKFGNDTGLQRYIEIDKDLVRGGIPLANGTEYYFVVSAYSYNTDPYTVPNVLETLSRRITVVAQDPKPGYSYAESGSVITATHTSGISNGKVTATVVDPGKVNGHSYEVTFEKSGNNVVWNLTDKTTGQVKVSKAPEAEGQASPIVDGLLVQVTGAPNDFASFQVVANGAGPLTPPEQGAFAFNNNGFPFIGESDRPSENQQVGPAEYGIHTGTTAANDGTFSYFKTRVTQSDARWPLIIPNDFEIRFTGYGKGNYGFEPLAFVTGASLGGTLIEVPFELWNVGNLADPNDDYRMFPYLIDSEGDGKFNFAAIDHPVSGGDNDPETDWFYWVQPKDMSKGDAGYKAILADIQANPDAHEYLGANVTAGTDVMRRMVIVNWNGGSVSAANWPANLNQAMVENGTIFRIITTKPNVPGKDVFTFTAPKVDYNIETAKEDVERINVFPNPYYAVNPREINKYQRYVTFNHLPAKATIRVFNLAGQLIKTIEKDSPEQFATWNLNNESELPAASGLYVIHIDMPDLGKTKILKLAVIQEQQILDRF